MDPVPIKITSSIHGTQELILLPKGKTTIETVKFPSMPVAVEVDPRNTLLKEARVRNASG